MGARGLDAVMPMHVWIGPTGHIKRAGPTFQKLRTGAGLIGQRFAELLEFRRPRAVTSVADLRAQDGQPVQVMFRKDPRTTLKGVIVALPQDQGVLLNLSFGFKLAEVVRDFGLKSKDFAPSDPAVEMLYLIEAQAAVLKESKKLNSRLEGAKIAAEEQAFTDTLTGLKNRRALDHVLMRMIADPRARRFGMMTVDLDFFKAVNDSFGHAAGDHVLQEAAKILVEETRAKDVIARTGGDEFVLVLMDCEDVPKLSRIADRIIRRLERPILFDGLECRISASIGISLSSYYPDLTIERISLDADAALYQSKEQGRGCSTLFQPQDMREGSTS